MRKRNGTRPSNSEMRGVPRLALTHGQTLWLLSELGFREGVTASTFNHYVKSLRRLGVPFEYGKGRRTMGGLYLDLSIQYMAGKMIKFGPPRAISPFEAVSMYAGAKTPARSYLPLNVSTVAEMILTRTRVLPRISRGRAARSPVTN
jgi:hypothetical protein